MWEWIAGIAALAAVAMLIWFCLRLIKRSQDDRSHKGEDDTKSGWVA